MLAGPAEQPRGDLHEPVMHANRRQLLAAAAAWPLVGAGEARAAEAAAPLRLVVPFAPGGGVDAVARLLAPALGAQWRAPVVVENRPGGSGTVGGRAVLAAPADGRTLLLSAATHLLARHVLAQPPYDPEADFAPVARVGQAPLMLVASRARAESTLPDLLAAIRAQPGQWTAAIAAAGAPGHLALLRLALQAGLKLAYVPYKGTQPALLDVAGGHADLLLDSMITLEAMVRAGRVRAIAVTAPQRSPLAPDVPTFREGGLADFSFATWYGVWAPADTPAPRVAALNAAINAAAADVERRGGWAPIGLAPVAETPEQFRRFAAANTAEGARLLKAAHFTPE